MVEYAMTPTRYHTLYRRFLESGPNHLFYHGDYKHGESVLDLCCGIGRATIYAVEHGAKFVRAIDESEELISNLRGFLYSSHHGDGFDGRVIVKDVISGMEELVVWGRKFDFIVCQQAINYWVWHYNYIPILVSRLMHEGSRFVFNTFNTMPPADPKVTTYKYGHRQYVEVVQSVSNGHGGIDIHHWQSCTGEKPHFTKFAWISPDKFGSILGHYFDFDRISKGKTDIYVCTLRERK